MGVGGMEDEEAEDVIIGEDGTVMRARGELIESTDTSELLLLVELLPLSSLLLVSNQRRINKHLTNTWTLTF